MKGSSIRIILHRLVTVYCPRVLFGVYYVREREREFKNIIISTLRVPRRDIEFHTRHIHYLYVYIWSVCYYKQRGFTRAHTFSISRLSATLSHTSTQTDRQDACESHSNVIYKVTYYYYYFKQNCLIR